MKELLLNQKFDEIDSTESFLYQDFERSGISRKTIDKYINLGYLSEKDYGWELYYPELYANKKTAYINKRLKNVEGSGKYLKPKGLPTAIFRPLDLNPAILKEKLEYIIITEGDKKAIKAVQEGFNCISLCGVWNWKQKVREEEPSDNVKTKSNDTEESILYGDIIPDLVNADFENKVVYLCYDNDMWHKESVYKALYHFAAYLLHDKKAIVKIIELPKGEAKGVDDYLMKYGAEEFQKLMDKAETITLKDVQKKLSSRKSLREFPLNIFPKAISELIKDLHRRLDAPIEYIACTFLAVVSILLDGHFKILVKPDSNWVEHPIIWLALVGSPSQRKTPALDIGRKILDDVDRILQNDYESDILEYKDKKEYRKRQLKRQKSSEKTGENIPNETIIPEPQKPLKSRITTQDITTESLAYVIEANKKNNLGVAIFIDELSFFLKGLNQYKKGGNDAEYFLQSWSKKRQNIVRVSSKIDMTVDTGHNIVGGIQPKVLFETLMKNGIESSNGMLERWLFCCSEYEEQGFYDLEMSNSSYDIETFDQICRQIFSYIFTKPDRIIEYRFTSDAQKTFLNFYNKVIQKKKSITGILSSYWQKQTNYVTRFAMILHAFQNFKEEFISTETVKNAILLSSYFVRNFENIISAKLNNNSLENTVLAYLQAKNIKTISPTQLYKNNASKYKTKENTKLILENLVNKGHGRFLKAKNGVTFIFYGN